jgi:hypothetical protein
LRIDDVDESIGIFEDHLLVGCGVVEIVFSGKVVDFEFDFFDFELVVFYFVGLPKHHGLFGHHFLEDDFCDTAST